MSKLLRTINRLKNPRDLWLFLQILSMLTFLPGRIRRRSLPDLLAEVDPGVAGGPRKEAKLQKTVGFVDSLLRYRLFQRYGKCLLRSMVLFRFLRLQGWPVEIHFGVRKTGEDGGGGPGHHGAGAEEKAAESGNVDITGHSWLVLAGEPFMEPAGHLDRYSTTFTYPAQ